MKEDNPKGKTKKEPTYPPGFSSEDFEPVNIKSIKKNDEGFQIEYGSSPPKKEGDIYHYENVESVYKILRDGKQINTPNSIPVETKSESLAKKIKEDLNLYGEMYEFAYSMVNFLYSHIEFFEPGTRENLQNAILNDFRTDWTLRCPFEDETQSKTWENIFGNRKSRESELPKWLEGLSQSQLGGVVIIGTTFDSVNTAYILTNQYKEGDFSGFAEYYKKNFTEYSKNKQEGMYDYWPLDKTIAIFKNYLFWQNLEL